MSDAFTACERCSGTTSHWTDLPPIGGDPGYHVYHCPACDHFTWRKCQKSANQAQQQQQPQNGPKDSEKK